MALFIYILFRYRRDVTIEGLPYLGHDRHNGEIAAFHLSRSVHSVHVNIISAHLFKLCDLCGYFLSKSPTCIDGLGKGWKSFVRCSAGHGSCVEKNSNSKPDVMSSQKMTILDGKKWSY